jgi:hypothetical protein
MALEEERKAEHRQGDRPLLVTLVLKDGVGSRTEAKLNRQHNVYEVCMSALLIIKGSNPVCVFLPCSSAAHARQLSLSDLLVSRPRQLLKLFPDDKSQWGAPTPRTSQTGAAAAASPAAAKKQQQQQQGDAADDQAAAAAPGEGQKAAEDGRGRGVAGSAALSDPNHPQHRSDAYQRLRELVYASEHIDPDYVLSKLGQVGALLFCLCVFLLLLLLLLL